MLFAHAVDEKFDPSAARTGIRVELLTLHEHFSQLSQETPVRPLVKALRAEMFEFLAAA
jgi:hypothetical protein